MAWFDGTINSEAETLEREFPIFVSEGLRMNADGTRMALINTFEKESKLYRLADPHLENGVYGGKMFYHIFTGNDANAARRAIGDFVAGGCGKGEYEVSLYRKDDDGLSMYSYGKLHTEHSPSPEIIECCKEIANKDLFVLPLKVFAFNCPVCGEKTLQYRGMFDICECCGWEDEGIDGDDDEPAIGPNGDYTIRQYRELYLNRLNKLYGKPFEALTKEEKILSPNWLHDF